MIIGLVAGGIFALIIRGWFYQPVKIDTMAMEPTLRFGQVYMLKKWKKSFLIGDIVLCETSTGAILSRIVGKGGDRIAIQDKILFRNGDPIPNQLYGAQWLDSRPPLPVHLTNRDQFPETRIPDNHFFLLGDNRDLSMDSRTLGSMPKDCLLGTISEGN